MSKPYARLVVTLTVDKEKALCFPKRTILMQQTLQITYPSKEYHLESHMKL